MDNNLITCCCGKQCKSRKNLRMHQPSDSIDVIINKYRHGKDTTTIIFASPTGISIIDLVNRYVMKETPLPRIKLSKTSIQWSEANAYFHSQRSALQNIADIDNFTTSFQS
ncbi:hypothetical protein HELRODRAFT_183569 [Helobdella robusta]|uniref:Uncharacterized protein n=1 Tax=Helobdella robusta TaxID=6412 RepID=T1FJU9_HELRO|nr:hypothetical protein HELRODRAFT_183569 [Helobdella robusta]ESO10473.1 hypothetical protein HELRODRAFT_183569 [Helobdella robusta]